MLRRRKCRDCWLEIRSSGRSHPDRLHFHFFHACNLLPLLLREHNSEVGLVTSSIPRGLSSDLTDSSCLDLDLIAAHHFAKAFHCSEMKFPA